MNTFQAQAIHPAYRMKSPLQTQLTGIAQKGDGKNPTGETRKNSKTIHSGQFMISRLHDKSPGDYLSDDEEDEVPQGTAEKTPGGGYNFDDASTDTYTTYSFGPKSTQTLAIDASLSTLFEHMTLAYSGKITSPKWKPFRGMHLRVKDKIRLNNIIWREWHMQYVFGKNPLVCHFATPLHDEVHTKPEAIVLEGYYWKRRLDTITNEYKRFRKFFKHQRPPPMEEASTNALLEKVGEIWTSADFPRHLQTSYTDLMLNSRDLQDMMDLSDSLFTSLNQPFAFPVPRELSGLGYGDFIQPGLVQLQPNLDDFMDLDPLTDMLASSRSQSFGHQAENSQSTSQIKLQHGDVEMGSSPQVVHSTFSQPSPGPSNTMMVDSPRLTPSPASAEHDPMIVDTENFILNQLQLIQQQKQVDERNRQQQQQIQQQKVMEMQQKKQQEELLRRQEQQKLQQQFLDQQKLEQQQRQQQQQQQQQQLQKSQNLQTLLQNPQLKSILSAMGENAPALLDELTKSLQAKQSPQATIVTQSQGASKAQLVNSNMSTQINTPQSQQPTLTSGNSSLITNLLSTSSLIAQQQKTPVQFVNNSSAKPRTSSGKYAGSNSILEALNADEKQNALNKMQPQIILQPRQIPCASVPKKDNAGFIIPNVPLRAKGNNKQRVIAPAPPVSMTKNQSALSQQNSYLAQLLTTGTYPGALVNVKEETSLANLPPIQPAPVSQHNILQAQSQSTPITVSLQGPTPDFPTSVLLAAASHAFSSNSMTVKDILQNVTLASPSPPTVILATSSPQPKPESFISPVASPSPSTSPMFSPTSITSPVSLSSPASTSMEDYQYTMKSPEASYTEMQIVDGRDDDCKKVTHLSSEKKRRYNIKAAGQVQKSGFEVLHSLIPSLSSNPNAKVSKAAMLQKTAEYCRKLKTERSQMQKEADILKQEIGSLNQAISVCQQQLPATGVPVTRQRADQMKEMFEEYVKQRTLTNWKFWIFSLIIRNLFDSFNTMVSTASVDELCRSALAWLDQHCSLPSLRPIAANAMRHLSTTTSILSDPARVPEQAAQAVIKRQKSAGDENT